MGISVHGGRFTCNLLIIPERHNRRGQKEKLTAILLYINDLSRPNNKSIIV